MFKVIDCLGNERNIPKGNPHLWAMKPTDEKVIGEDGTEYVNKDQNIELCNEIIGEARKNAYRAQTDDVFFKYQRDEITKKDWLDAVGVVKAKYPKKEKS